MEEAAIGEEAGGLRLRAFRLRPLKGFQRFVSRFIDLPIGADIEIAAAVVFEGGQSRVLGKDLRRGAEGERTLETHAAADLGQLPPVGLGFAGGGKIAPLTGNAAFRVGDGAVLLAPAERWQENMRKLRRIGVGEDVGDDDEGTGGDCGSDGIGIRHRDDRVGRHDPECLDPAVGDGAEHVDGLQAGFAGNVGRLPEALDAVAILGIFDRHMGGQHVGKAADLAAAHGVRLAGERERSHAGPADAAGREMTVDDGVDLVGAGSGLVDALAVAGDDLFGFLEQAEELAQLHGGQAGQFHQVGDAEGRGRGESLGETIGVRADIVLVDRSGAGEVGQQAHEQRHVAIRPDRQVQVGDIGRHRAARIDDDDLHAGPGGLGGGEALVDDRMAPGEVGTGQDDQIGKLDVLIGTGNGIGAESTAMAGDRGGHAQARIGVDIGRADEALHQLVGDVVVLRQQLAGNVEGHRIGAMLGDRFGKAGGDKVKRFVPARASSVDLRDEEHVRRDRWFRQAPSPWNTAVRNWRDDPGRP